MKFCTLVISISLLVGCRNSPSKTSIINLDQVATEQKDATEVKVQEFLEKDSVKIKGRLSLISKTTDLYDLLGAPDRIVSPDLNDVCVSYYSKDFNYAYYDDTQFEIYGDTSVLVSINFAGKRQLELKTTGLTLNNETTLAQLGHFFPNSVDHKYDLDVKGIGRMIAVTIAISKQPSDDSWLFLFYRGKLLRIDYYMPC